MKRLAALVVLGAIGAGSMAAGSDTREFSTWRGDYLLGCGGCHGLDGVSNAKLVPQLRDQVGYFLTLKTGRDYLARVPNVAFSTASDQELAGLLNFMVFVIGGPSAPSRAKPYTAPEVARLRRHPLTEVSLVAYRRQLVETLIAEHHAPESLRIYGRDDYAGTDSVADARGTMSGARAVK